MRTFQPLKVAVVGLGAFGRLHCHTLTGLAEAELVALVDSREGQAENLRQELLRDGQQGAQGPRAFTSLAGLLESGCADALVIATRTDTHVALAREALGGGLHVLVEKPVGATSAEISHLEEYARGMPGIAMAGHVCLFHSLTAPLIQQVRRDGWKAAHFVRHRPAETARLFAEEHPFRMTMIHDLCVLAQMAENEEPAHVHGHDSVNAAGTADMSWATLRWRDGRVATLHAHWTLPAASPPDGWDETEVFGAGFHVRLNTNPQSCVRMGERAEWPQTLEMSEVGGRPTGMLAEELRSFIAACNGAGVAAGCRLADAVQVQRWVEKLMHCAVHERVRTSGNAG